MSAPEPVAEPGAPAWPGGLVFTDEVLPELEIRELVPLFLLEGNFSIFSTQEVTTYLEALFLPRDGDAATVRARAFAALHAALLNPPPSTAEIRGTIPVLRNPRKDLNDEEPGEVINSIAVARSAPTFAQRQRALDGVFFPLETDAETLELDTEADVLYKPTRPEGVTAGIASQADVSQATRLFPLDSDYPLILEGLQFQRPMYSQHHTLSEKAGAMRERRDGLVPLPETPEAAFALALDDLAKTVEESGAADAHTLKAAMDLYGLNLDTLSEKDTEALLDRVKKAFRAADRRPADAGGRRSAAPKGKKVLTATETGRALILGLQEYLKRPATFQDRLGLYETYLQNPPPMPALSEIPETLTGLAEALSRREIELRDVVEYLRIMRLRRIYDFIRSQIEAYSKANPESLQAAQKAAATLRMAWDRLVAPSIAISSLRFPIAADMEEIQAGRDTSNYDGNPTDDPELGGMVPDAAAVVAASEAAETLGTTAFADEADDALWEMAETQETTETSTPAGLGIVGMPPGSDEVARILLPVFQRLSRATGLPVNYVALVELWRARVLRRATTEVWTEATAPAGAVAPAAAAAPLDFLDITSVQEYIAVHWPSEEHARLRARTRDIHQELTAAVRDAFVLGVSYWLITVQQAAVARALVFDPLAGNVRYLDKWSPFGPPLSGTTAGAAAMGEPGALTYMAYVILDTPLSGTVAGVETALRFADVASLYSAVLRESRNAFPDECAALATHWATYRAETEQVTERVKAAEVSLAEAIQLKQRHRVLREYIKVLLYLPGLLSGKGPRAVGPGAAAAGCCLQKLNADYKADMDWRTQNKRLAQLKDTFAKKRMTRVDRPALALPRGAVAPAEAPPTAPAAPEVAAPEVAVPEVAAPEVAAPEPVVIAWLNSLATRPPLTLLPQGLLAGIRNDSRILAPMTERALTLAIRTSQKRMPGFPEKLVAQVGTDELTGLLTLVATTLAHRRTSYAPESPEAVALTEAMVAIRTFKTEWSHLDSIVDERDLPDLRRIAQYVLARAICSPADPSAGGAAARTLSLPQAVQAAFLPATVKETLTVIAAALAAREMPTVEDQQAFITQKREEQKTQILSELDVLTVEERELVLQSRRLGFGSVGALGGALRGTEAPAAPGEEGPATALAAAPVAEHDAWAEALDFQAGMGQNPDDMNEDAI
jgi:hypothetical protein